MPQIGPLEVLLLAVIALVVFGPQKLPEIARSVGKAVTEFRRQAAQVRSEFSSDMDLSDVEDERSVPSAGPDEEPATAGPSGTAEKRDAPPSGDPGAIPEERPQDHPRG